MGTRRKERIRKILADRDFEALEKWANETRAPLRRLFSLTYDPDPLIRCRATEAIGETAALIAPRDTEQVRTFVRGLIWLMTEESGGIGWQAPEAIAEICVKVPELLDEYARLLPQFLAEESFVPSTCAALKRIAPVCPKLIRDSTFLLKAASDNELSVWTYDFAKGTPVKTTVEKLVRQLVKI